MTTKKLLDNLIMSFSKPFHRNYRPNIKSTYSDWAYIKDHEYANSPEYYTRAFSIIQKDLLTIFEYIEPSSENEEVYSFRIHELLVRVCIEVEANFKAILRENIYNPIYKKGSDKGKPIPERKWNINNYKIVNKTHHLDNYSVKIPFWKGENSINKPFVEWGSNKELTWYQAYNKSKHNRLDDFVQANFINLITAFCGLFVLLSSQFKTESFSPGGTTIGNPNDKYYNGEFGIGGFLMIEFPNNWEEDEKYNFDWNNLKNEANRFDKIDYNNLVY